MKLFKGFFNRKKKLSKYKDEIIEISAIKVRDNVIEDTFSYLIKPNNEIPYFITELTKITNEMVENALLIEEVLPRFIDFIESSSLDE